MVQKADNLTRYIQEKLVQNNLEDRVNVIHLSDHGMQSVHVANIIDLNDFLVNGTYKLYGKTPTLQLVPTDASEFGKWLYFLSAM